MSICKKKKYGKIRKQEKKMSDDEIKASHFKTMKELLEHLKMWERDDDYDAYCRFFDYECSYAMAHYIEKLQKENKNADERNHSLGLGFIQIGEKLGLKGFGIQTILLEIEKIQKENEELKEELDYYKQNENQDFDERDYYEE